MLQENRKSINSTHCKCIYYQCSFVLNCRGGDILRKKNTKWERGQNRGGVGCTKMPDRHMYMSTKMILGKI